MQALLCVYLAPFAPVKVLHFSMNVTAQSETEQEHEPLGMIDRIDFYFIVPPQQSLGTVGQFALDFALVCVTSVLVSVQLMSK